VTQRLKLGSEGNFTVMTGTLTTTDTTLPHSIGGIVFQSRNISAAGLKINGVTYTGGVAAGVATINSTLSGNVTFTAGTNISLYTSGNSIVIGVSGSTSGGGGVTTINTTLSGNVTFTAGSNISLYKSGNSIVIGVSGSTSGGGGVTTINTTLSGNVTFTAGTNISLYSTGNNITIQTNVSGTYGGVVLSGNAVTASALTTTGGLKSSIGGVVLQSGYISASGVVTSPSNLSNTIGGVTLQNNAVTVDRINIGGVSVDSIVSTINGYKSDITITGGTGIQVVPDKGDNRISTLPIPVTVYFSAGIGPMILPDTGRGDIFLIPTDYSSSPFIPIQLVFPLNPYLVPTGTSWRITNSMGSNFLNFTYEVFNADLPNLDPGPNKSGTFIVNPNQSILIVKTDAAKTYYKVN